MKRLVRSRSGRQIYGPKWQNIEGTDEIDSDEGHHSASVESTEIAQVPGNTIPTSGVAAAAPTVIETNVVQPPIRGQPKGQDNHENQTPKGNNIRTGSRSDLQSSMYEAVLVGDWLAAEVLLERDPSLLRDEITERGDRALHVAAAMRNKEFVEKLVQRMSPSDLEILVDGRGYTACCYAAMSGAVEIAEVMMEKNPNLVSARDNNGRTAIHKAASHGNAAMVSYFLKSIKVEDLSEQEWFDLLLVAVRCKMCGVALEILEKDGSLATMRDPDGCTALHLLARLDISSDFFTSKLEGGWAWHIHFGTRRFLVFPPWRRRREMQSHLLGWTIMFDGEMQSDLRLLVEKLWAEIQRLDQASVLELIKKPSILHDAAKVGNVELITMLTHTYPDLIWDTDDNGYTIFHIAVIYRHENVFNLIRQIGGLKGLIAISRDINGNNILHLAGELTPLNRRKIVPLSALQMKREIAWFKNVEALVPPLCLEERNKDGHKPRELFSMRHKKLLVESEIWMRNTADSCMLIATIMLTVVFAAAFTPPGGYNGNTGMPILFKSKWFTCFVIFEALALLGSTWSIMHFWSIMTSSFEEDQFLFILPNRLRMGLIGLLGSLIGAISAFMSAYFLVFLEERARLVKSVILFVYVVLFLVTYDLYNKLSFNVNLPLYFSRTLRRPSRHRLFRRHDATRKKE